MQEGKIKDNYNVGLLGMLRAQGLLLDRNSDFETPLVPPAEHGDE